MKHFRNLSDVQGAYDIIAYKMHIDLTEAWLYFVFNKLFGKKGSIELDVLNKYFICQCCDHMGHQGVKPEGWWYLRHVSMVNLSKSKSSTRKYNET